MSIHLLIAMLSQFWPMIPGSASGSGWRGRASDLDGCGQDGAPSYSAQEGRIARAVYFRYNTFFNPYMFEYVVLYIRSVIPDVEYQTLYIK